MRAATLLLFAGSASVALSQQQSVCNFQARTCLSCASGFPSTPQCIWCPTPGVPNAGYCIDTNLGAVCLSTPYNNPAMCPAAGGGGGVPSGGGSAPTNDDPFSPSGGSGGTGGSGLQSTGYPSGTTSAIGGALIALSFLAVIMGVGIWLSCVTVGHNAAAAASKNAAVVAANPLASLASPGIAPAASPAVDVAPTAMNAAVGATGGVMAPSVFFPAWSSQLSSHPSTRRIALYLLVALTGFLCIWLICAFAAPWATFQVSNVPIVGTVSAYYMLLTATVCGGAQCQTQSIADSSLRAGFAMLLLAFFSSLAQLALAGVAAVNVALRHGRGLGAVLPHINTEWVQFILCQCTMILTIIGLAVAGSRFSSASGDVAIDKAAAVGCGAMAVIFCAFISILLWFLMKNPFVVRGSTRRGSTAAGSAITIFPPGTVPAAHLPSTPARGDFAPIAVGGGASLAVRTTVI